jgi:hypothetical protein
MSRITCCNCRHGRHLQYIYLWVDEWCKYPRYSRLGIQLKLATAKRRSVCEGDDGVKLVLGVCTSRRGGWTSEATTEVRVLQVHVNSVSNRCSVLQYCAPQQQAQASVSFSRCCLLFVVCCLLLALLLLCAVCCCVCAWGVCLGVCCALFSVVHPARYTGGPGAPHRNFPSGELEAVTTLHLFISAAVALHCIRPSINPFHSTAYSGIGCLH